MVLHCYQGKEWVINNKEAGVVSLGLAEQLQALRQMNWVEMEDSNCNTTGLCFVTGKPIYCLSWFNPSLQPSTTQPPTGVQWDAGDRMGRTKVRKLMVWGKNSWHIKIKLLLLLLILLILLFIIILQWKGGRQREINATTDKQCIWKQLLPRQPLSSPRGSWGSVAPDVPPYNFMPIPCLLTGRVMWEALTE